MNPIREYENQRVEQSEIDQAWAEEAESRLDAYLRGEMTAVPLDEVLRSFGVDDVA